MILAAPSIPEPDSPTLLGDVRRALSFYPEAVAHPRRLADHLGADERAVRECLEVLRVEGEVLA